MANAAPTCASSAVGTAAAAGARSTDQNFTPMSKQLSAKADEAVN